MPAEVHAIFADAPPRTGMYESFYLRAVAPDRPLGVWIRHTVHKPPGHSPRGSVWCTVFDGDAPPFMRKLTTNALSAPGGGWIAVGDSRIGPGEAEGSCGEARWSLRLDSDEPELRHLPREWLYRAPLPRTKLTSPMPAARFTGTLELPSPTPGAPPGPAPGAPPGPAPGAPPGPVDGAPPGPVDGAPPGPVDGAPTRPPATAASPPSPPSPPAAAAPRRTLALDGWRGMVGHNWGAQHAERWIWLHGVGFEQQPDAWIDVAIGRVRVAGLIAPWVASGALCIDGERHRLGGLGARGLLVAERPERCVLSLPGAGGLLVEAHVKAPPTALAGWRYADPDGGEHDVSNCSIAALTLTVRRPGRPARTLRTAHGAAYELGMREHDHGIPIAPFGDA
jgi:hypothetical protein